MTKPGSRATAPNTVRQTKQSARQRSDLRPAIGAFVNVSQTILSPTLQPPALTPEECNAIAQCVIALSSAKAPWSRCLIDGLRKKISDGHNRRR
jgi:hypothetical protein